MHHKKPAHDTILFLQKTRFHVQDVASYSQLPKTLPTMSLPMPPIDDAAGALQAGEAPGGILVTETAPAFASPVERRHRIADTPRNLIVLGFAELCGTFMFLLLSFVGTQAALNNNVGANGEPVTRLYPFTLLYIASSFGAALTVNVWVFYRVSVCMFNPCVCSALRTIAP